MTTITDTQRLDWLDEHCEKLIDERQVHGEWELWFYGDIAMGGTVREAVDKAMSFKKEIDD